MSLIRPTPFKPGLGLQDGSQMNAEGSAPKYTMEIGITASGGNQVTAYPLDATISVIVAGASGTGVKMPFPFAGLTIDVINRSGSSKILYGYALDTVGGGSSVSMGDQTQIQLYCTGSDWIVSAFSQWNVGVVNAIGDGLILNSGTLSAAQTLTSGITATGTNQGTAAPLTSDINIVGTVASGTGVILTSSPPFHQRVANRGANSLLVYPNSGAQIENYGTNAGALLTVGSSVDFMPDGSTQWWTA